MGIVLNISFKKNKLFGQTRIHPDGINKHRITEQRLAASSYKETSTPHKELCKIGAVSLQESELWYDQIVVIGAMTAR